VFTVNANRWCRSTHHHHQNVIYFDVPSGRTSRQELQTSGTLHFRLADFMTLPSKTWPNSWRGKEIAFLDGVPCTDWHTGSGRYSDLGLETETWKGMGSVGRHNIMPSTGFWSTMITPTPWLQVLESFFVPATAWPITITQWFICYRQKIMPKFEGRTWKLLPLSHVGCWSDWRAKKLF